MNSSTQLGKLAFDLFAKVLECNRSNGNNDLEIKHHNDEIYEDDEFLLLFNIHQIKTKILFRSQSVHLLLDLLFKHLLMEIEQQDDQNLPCSDQEQKIQQLLDQLMEISWTQLHTGHWSDVCPEWRSLFGLISLLHVAFNIYKRSEHILNGNKELDPQFMKQLLKKCDEGLMMGDDTYRQYIHNFADSIHDFLIEKLGIPPLTCGNDKNKDDEMENEENTSSKKRKLSQDLRSQVIFSSPPKPIQVVDAISVMEFKAKYFDKQLPCIIKNAATEWTAYKNWRNIDHLLQKAAYRVVPVEVGEFYTSEDWSQRLMPFHEYVKTYVLQMDQEESANTVNNRNIGYLAQHPLFEQINVLRKDIQEPIYCMLGENGEVTSVNAWFGPCNTISPLHTDPYDNILVQVCGHKYVRIYHPDTTPNLYKRKTGLLQSNTSEIENLFVLRGQEEERKRLMEMYPLLSEAENHCWECILSEGDMLFIPKLYWHYIQSLSISFSISYWFM